MYSAVTTNGAPPADDGTVTYAGIAGASPSSSDPAAAAEGGLECLALTETPVSGNVLRELASHSASLDKTRHALIK